MSPANREDPAFRLTLLLGLAVAAELLNRAGSWHLCGGVCRGNHPAPAALASLAALVTLAALTGLGTWWLRGLTLSPGFRSLMGDLERHTVPVTRLVTATTTLLTALAGGLLGISLCIHLRLWSGAALAGEPPIEPGAGLCLLMALVLSRGLTLPPQGETVPVEKEETP